ncbi:hypothetical protein VKT23_015650 [Stygiomarasmius scandens]|uniref:Uncharacterized protein n=1 Tax=Marasmiellus scandens TaxID=2682957 RepID=A0ABR1J1D2_9AGAR
MQASEKPPLHSSRPRQPNSVYKCFLWIFGFIALVISGFVAYFLYIFLQALYQTFTYPHQYMYQNQSLSEVSNRSSVVQPLIGKEQTFDLAVSVWIRATKAKEEEWRELQKSFVNSNLDSEERLQFMQSPNETDQKISVLLGFDEDELLYGQKNDLYHPLYSDIVFRGLRLSDKGVAANINFTVPTEKFRDAKLSNFDLQGTIVLIPTSPSLMDSVVNFSSWIPEELLLNRPPRRTWPFPMGSEDTGEKKVTDLALESFSVAIPLVEFHEIPSRCPIGNDTESKGETDLEQGGIIVDVDGNVNFTSFVKKLVLKNARTEKHPHIITWSQIRVIDETHVMNLEVYDRAHEKLKKTSCGQDLKASRPIKPNYKLCDRTYLETGGLETKLQLEIKDANGETHAEWAYVPFLTTFPYASGPMDLIPVPVDRENCTGETILDANSTSIFNHTADSMDITWHISFSGRSPAKDTIGNVFASPYALNHSQSDYDKVNAQDTVEIWNGLRGVIKPGAHPRRRMVLSTVGFTANLLNFFLVSVYWYTRNSTIYISIPGIYLLVTSELCALVGIIQSRDEEKILFIVILALIAGPPVLFQLRTALRIELVWKGWIPTLTRTRSSHLERASRRLDATSGNVRLALLSILFIFFYFVPSKHQTLISPLNPEPTSNSNKRTWHSEVLDSLDLSSWTTGIISQIILNHKSGYFAGAYKTQSLLTALATVAQLLQYIPMIVGTYQTRWGVDVSSITSWGVVLVVAYQALTLPAATTIGLDEDEE